VEKYVGVRRGGGIVGPLFHFIIFYIFPSRLKVNITTRVGSNTLGLQTDLHKSDDILKEKERNAFSQTSARVLTCPTDRVSGHEVKIHGNSRYQVFKLEKKQTMIKVIFYKTNLSDSCCT
jgi:hypothetical protein